MHPFCFDTWAVFVPLQLIKSIILLGAQNLPDWALIPREHCKNLQSICNPILNMMNIHVFESQATQLSLPHPARNETTKDSSSIISSPPPFSRVGLIGEKQSENEYMQQVCNSNSKLFQISCKKASTSFTMPSQFEQSNDHMWLDTWNLKLHPTGIWKWAFCKALEFHLNFNL